MPITVTEYQDLFFDALEYIKTDIIAPNSPGSHIETRYIASEGRDDESWLGYLRDRDNNVDIWLMTVNFLRGMSQEERSSQSSPVAVGTFSKPVSITIDYYADYRQGVDAVNTEREFLKKVMAVDLAFEKKVGCLFGSAYIESWDFRMKLRRFAQASTHWANGMLNLRIDEIFLN